MDDSYTLFHRLEQKRPVHTSIDNNMGKLSEKSFQAFDQSHFYFNLHSDDDTHKIATLVDFPISKQC